MNACSQVAKPHTPVPVEWHERKVVPVYRRDFAARCIDAAAGRRYRDLVLAPGGVGKILDHLTTFLGRPPSQEAFLKSRGIA